MAINANAVFEIRSTATANNANGGGFVTGASGTDYSQQNAAQYNLTGASNGAASATVSHASASADMVGNIAHIISGTNFTPGWYEIISVVAGVSITFDRNCTTGAGASGVINIGGALSLNGTGTGISDDAFFESLIAGNKVWIKSGSYTVTAVAITTAAGTASAPINVEGYNSTRGDRPTTDATRPQLNLNTGQLSSGSFFNWSYIYFFTNSSVGVISSGSTNRYWWVKMVNTSTTADRFGLNFVGASTHSQFYFCEFICYRGRAVNIGTTNDAVHFFGCIMRDSNVGVLHSGGSSHQSIYINCLIYGNVTYGMDITGKTGATISILNCTFHGSQNKLGTGINIQTGVAFARVMNCIFSGLAVGIAQADATSLGSIDMSNNFYNNTSDVTNWSKGHLTYALNPNFTSASTLSGATATTSGSVLTQSGADFSSVTDGVDFVYISAGTGVTAGKYKITAHTTTTLTLDIAPGTNATADKVWQINIGNNYGIGPNLKAKGLPSNFPLDLTTSYLDIGAVQRKEPQIAYGSVG
jgi:hypothetical protein